MKVYTLGFVFNDDLTRVLLMHKNRPERQVGKINGVGGKIEPGEESGDCIVREVHEETGAKTRKEDWVYFGEIKSRDWRVDLYALVYEGEASDFTTTTDEKLEWFAVDNLPENVLEKLYWMIPMALSKLENKEMKTCSVEYV
jgi:8-oxo-dGTP diphosphatase